MSNGIRKEKRTAVQNVALCGNVSEDHSQHRRGAGRRDRAGQKTEEECAPETAGLHLVRFLERKRDRDEAHELEPHGYGDHGKADIQPLARKGKEVAHGRCRSAEEREGDRQTENEDKRIDSGLLLVASGIAAHVTDDERYGSEHAGAGG